MGPKKLSENSSKSHEKHLVDCTSKWDLLGLYLTNIAQTGQFLSCLNLSFLTDCHIIARLVRFSITLEERFLKANQS